MMQLFLATIVMLVCSTPALGGHQEMPGPPDFCINAAGAFRKEAPSAETGEFEPCGSWQSNSCCTPETVGSINENGYVSLYNFSWELCGPVSQQCEAFLKNEACFYECEPMLGYFQIGNMNAIKDVPVCSSYCDNWFEACRDDMTCVQDWLTNFDQGLEQGGNTCPANRECMTFAEVFIDGKGFCDTIWGSVYFYSEDEDNCTVFTFDADMPNPNSELSFPVDDGSERVQSSILIVAALAVGLPFSSFIM